MEYEKEKLFVDEALVETDEDTVRGSISDESSDPETEEPSKEKLRMKIKITKAVKDEGLSHRTCHVCGKEFSSGKAYGGHVRIHSKHSKNGLVKKIPNMKQEKKKQISSDAALTKWNGCSTIKSGDLKLNDGKPTCCLCGKHFQSMNSLFGHMRSHPERGRKGIGPHHKNGCCSIVSENVIIEADEINFTAEQHLGTLKDPLTPLLNWSSKGKRGQNCLPNLVPEAADCLLKLARGESGGHSQSNEQRIEKSMIRNQSDFPSNKPKIDACKAWELTGETKEARKSGNIIEERMDKVKIKAVLKTKSNQVAVYVDSEWGESDWPKEDKNKMMESGKQLTDNSLINRKMMTKEKKKRHYEIVDNIGRLDQNQRKISTKPKKCSHSLAVETSYQYGICDKTSLTGQAFGSDRKCYSAGLIEAPLGLVTFPAETSWIGPKIASDTEASQASEASHGGSKMLDFDLNEPYIDADEKGSKSTFSQVQK